MGYSVNDTIVVFDRVRENLLKTEGTFEEIVGRSIKQTIARSINTTLTTLLALVAIFFFGGETIKDFTGVLIIGIAVGAYSSVFFASPLLVAWEKFRQRA
jgi:preprotein translocase subunit SecF